MGKRGSLTNDAWVARALPMMPSVGETMPGLPEGVGQEAQFKDQIQSVPVTQEQPIKVFNPGLPTVTGGGGSSGESASTGQQSQGGHWKWVPPCGQQGGRPC